MRKFATFNIFLAVLQAGFDFLSLQAALLIGYWIWIAFPWHGNYQYFHEYAQILWMLPPIGVIVFKTVGLYKPQEGMIGVEEQSSIFKAIWIIYGIVFAMSFFYRGVSFSRLATFYSIWIAIAFISFERYLFRQFIEHLREKGVGVRHALIYGAGYHGQRLERWIKQSPKLGILVAGYLDDNYDALSKKPAPEKCLGSIENIESLVTERKISMLFIAHRNLEESKVLDILNRCRFLGLHCWVIPSVYQFYIERAVLSNIGGIPLIGFRENPSQSSYYTRIKRGCDLLWAIFFITALFPIFILVGLGIKITSKGPVFFNQVRIGQDGKKFSILKFRTLEVHSDGDAVSPELGPKHHKTMTRFAQFLRQTGLDEVPQLINVLKGEMSLVGPRPEMPFIVEKYGQLEKERLSVKPGITGLWQISEDRKRLLIHENMDYDLYYIENMSLNLDLAIMLKTVFVMFKRLFHITPS